MQVDLKGFSHDDVGDLQITGIKASLSGYSEYEMGCGEISAFYWRDNGGSPIFYTYRDMR